LPVFLLEKKAKLMSLCRAGCFYDTIAILTFKLLFVPALEVSGDLCQKQLQLILVVQINDALQLVEVFAHSGEDFFSLVAYQSLFILQNFVGEGHFVKKNISFVFHSSIMPIACPMGKGIKPPRL